MGWLWRSRQSRTMPGADPHDHAVSVQSNLWSQPRSFDYHGRAWRSDRRLPDDKACEVGVCMSSDAPRAASSLRRHDKRMHNAQVHNLAAAATTLLERAAAAPAGRAALTLVPRAGAPLKQTLLALRGGVHLAEHDAPGAGTLQVLQGRVRLVTSEESWALGQGDHLQIPSHRYRLEAWRTLPSS
jgi:quercetin dioxygenase-like cupin family protein